MTMNSPESLTVLYNLATKDSKDKQQSVETAELMREVGLKCIGFNGVRLLPHHLIQYLTRDRSQGQSTAWAPSVPLSQKISSNPSLQPQHGKPTQKISMPSSPAANHSGHPYTAPSTRSSTPNSLIRTPICPSSS